MKIKRETIIKLLKDREISVTENRIRIIECLTEDDIHFHAISDISNHTKLNTKSIYNNIKALISHGLINSATQGGVVKYAFDENIINEVPEIHITNSKGEISHLEVSKKIFNDIKKEVIKNNQEVVSISINVRTK